MSNIFQSEAQKFLLPLIKNELDSALSKDPTALIALLESRGIAIEHLAVDGAVAEAVKLGMSPVQAKAVGVLLENRGDSLITQDAPAFVKASLADAKSIIDKALGG